MSGSLPSVLWRCWLGSRKGIQPVKTSGQVLMWLSVGSELQIMCIWSSWCHCHPIIFCFIKIQNGLSFWCRLTQIVLEKKAIKWMLCSVVVISMSGMSNSNFCY